MTDGARVMSDLSYRSAIPQIVWPAVPGRAGGALAAILMQLEQSQWWPAARLQAMQFKQLTQLCSHAARQVPFYGDRFAALDWKAGQPMTPEIWSRLPLLSREDVQQSGAALQAKVLPKGHGRVLWSSLTQGHADALVAVKPLTQFQLAQISLQKAEMRIRTTRPLNAAEEDRVKSIAQRILGYPFEITISYHNEIPRGPSDKFQFFVQAMEKPTP